MSQTNSRLQGSGVVLPVGGTPGSVTAGEQIMSLEADGLKLIRPDGTKALVGFSGAEGYVLARAQSLVGTTIDTVLGTDFDNDQWHRAASFAGAPTVTMSATERGGVIVADSSATANSNGAAFPHGATVVFIDNPQTSRWYAYGRIAFGTAIDAQAQLQLLLSTPSGGNPIIRFGVIGPTSTSFYAYSVTNNAGAGTASGTTTVPIDQNVYHDFEVWNDGTTISLAIDGVVMATTAASNYGTNPVVLGIISANGTTAASRTIKCDKLFFCCARP